MTALEDKGPMQKYCEASVGCLQGNLLPQNIHQYKGSYLQGIAKDGGGGRFGGGGGVSAEPHVKINRMSSSSVGSPFEGGGYHRRSVQQHQGVEVRAAAFYPDFQKAVQQNQLHVVEARYYPLNCNYGGFPVDNQFQYVPFNYMQEFQYFVVIDFEATCDREKNPHPQEIIEFPSVLVNSVTGQLEDCFQIYVRPTSNHHLSDFCKELTGIQQNQVDKGVVLGDALLMHDKWLEEKGIKQTNFAVVTWSNWDCRVMLESECRFKKIRKPPYFDKWINLKVPFQEVFGGGARRCNLKEAVELAGLVWEGRAHCGLDDAKNTARLLTHLMHRGFKLSITNSLMWRPSSTELSPPPPTTTAGPSPMMMMMTTTQFQLSPAVAAAAVNKERDMYCYCGVKSSKRMVRKPGPKHGSSFFGCGNWTINRGAVCSFFEWAAAPPP